MSGVGTVRDAGPPLLWVGVRAVRQLFATRQARMAP